MTIIVEMLFALAALPLLAFGSLLSPRANSTNQTSIEILYPRNETYNLTVPMPIVLGVANLPPTEVLGNYTINWDLEGFDQSNMPAGLIYGMGKFYPLNETSTPAGSAPLIFADFVDLNAVFQKMTYDFGGYLVLTVWLSFDDSKRMPDICTNSTNGIVITIVSSVGFHVDREPGRFGLNQGAVDINLLTATGCPGVGAGVTVSTGKQRALTASTASSCIGAVVTATPTQRTGCAFTVDAAMASSISSSVSVLTIPPPTETLPTYTSNRAGSVPIQTGGFAAAGIVGAMLLL